MKKIIVFIIGIIFLFNGNLFAQESPLSEKQQKALEKADGKIKILADKKGENILNKLDDILTSIKYTPKYEQDEKTKIIIDSLLGSVRYHKDRLIRLQSSKQYNTWKKETYNQNEINNVDIEKIRQEWLKRNNEYRNNIGLHNYNYSDILNWSSYEWSMEQLSKKEMTHQRQYQTSYYDGDILTRRFYLKDIQFKIIGGFHHTENVGTGKIICDKSDCTEEFLKILKQSFDAMIAEKGQSYQNHYQSIINSQFKLIGFSIVRDKLKVNYYFTVHYGTELAKIK